MTAPGCIKPNNQFFSDNIEPRYPGVEMVEYVEKRTWGPRSQRLSSFPNDLSTIWSCAEDTYTGL